MVHILIYQMILILKDGYFKKQNLDRNEDNRVVIHLLSYKRFFCSVIYLSTLSLIHHKVNPMYRISYCNASFVLNLLNFTFKVQIAWFITQNITIIEVRSDKKFINSQQGFSWEKKKSFLISPMVLLHFLSFFCSI